jgi:hypothetical protein
MKLIAPPYLLFCVSIYAQPPSTGAATANGNCNIAISGTGNTINVQTCGPQQGDDIRKLLKAIASNEQLDTATIIKKLDECLRTMADRHLTPEQQSRIASELTPFAGQAINVIGPPGEPEIVGIANDVMHSLLAPDKGGLSNGAGWVISVFVGQDNARAVSNILIEIKVGADATSRAAASALAHSLRSEGLSVTGPIPPPRGYSGFTGMGTGESNPAAVITMTFGKKQLPQSR